MISLTPHIALLKVNKSDEIYLNIPDLESISYFKDFTEFGYLIEDISSPTEKKEAEKLATGFSEEIAQHNVFSKYIDEFDPI